MKEGAWLERTLEGSGTYYGRIGLWIRLNRQHMEH